MRIIAFYILLLFSTTQSFAQFGSYQASSLEMRATDANNDALLYSHHTIVTYNEMNGELKITLNTASLNGDMFPTQSNLQIDMDLLMPTDSLLIEITATFGDGQLSIKNQSGNLMTYQIPAYVNYKGIQLPVIMNYSYGSSMVKTTNVLYLNISLEYTPMVDNNVYIPFLNFYPTYIKMDMLDAKVNVISF